MGRYTGMEIWRLHMRAIIWYLIGMYPMTGGLSILRIIFLKR